MIRIEQSRTHIEEVRYTESFAPPSIILPKCRSLPTDYEWSRFDQPRLLRDTWHLLRPVWIRVQTWVGLPHRVIVPLASSQIYIYSFDQAYITWINEVRAWTLHAEGLDKDDATEIGRRLIPLEPMVSTPQWLSRASI